MSFQFPELLRPQYPSSPEVLLSALAWSVIGREHGTEAIGLIYERTDSVGNAPNSRKVKIERTKPTGEILLRFAEELRAAGMVDLNGALTPDVAKVIAEAMMGVPARKGVGRTSSAIGLAGALLQDSVGGLGTASPPNFARLLNSMYVLGGGSGKTAAERAFLAEQHYSCSPRLRPIERAFLRTTLAPFLRQDQRESWPPKAPEVHPATTPSDVPDWWSRDVIDAEIGTPFSWFRNSWDLLCSEEWYGLLPPRRWASWAICVLRHALGFGFLWESNFFLEVAKAVIDDQLEPSAAARWAVEPPRPLLQCQAGTISQMDVGPAMRHLLTTGLACRRVLMEASESGEFAATDLEGLIVALKEALSPATKDAIHRAISGLSGAPGLPNLKETVRYSLLTRSGAESVDHYGLLSVVSRNYLHVSPGAEWIVVMSAMAARGPSTPIRLGDVMQGLRALGFRPRIDFLLGQLERAGLCASAADGDEGIEINLGFGGR